MSIRSNGLAGSGEAIRIDAREFSQLLNDAKAFEPALARSIRKNIRDAAKPAVAEVKAEALAIPTKGLRSQGIRRAVAQGVGIRISAAKRGGAVTIAASPRRLPENHKAMNRLLNLEKWRHPVFGDRETWVNQTSRPYFGSVIWRYRDDILRAMAAALDEAKTRLPR